MLYGVYAGYAQEAPPFETVQFRSLDGLPITADLYETGDRSHPTLLLFHQSVSSRGEFRELAPHLVARGFNVLAVDLRWGGTDRWQRVVNETAVAFGTPAVLADVEAGDRSRVWPTIFAAYQDMLAAYDWLGIEGFSGAKLVLGSSFSAMLVLQLPQDRPVAAVLAYSPGEYYPADTTLARRWSADLTVPTYLAAAVEEEALVRPLYEALGTPQKFYFQATQGRHGASILYEDAANRADLEAFLAAFQPPQEVSFDTPDGVTVFGDLYDPHGDQAAPMLLLFHQGGSNARAEYGPLVPRLLAEGYVALALDQRRGGRRLGGTNRTADALEGEAGSYCSVYPDLEAALRYVQAAGYTGPVVAWGSSYSATLALQLAANHPEVVQGVLAFSPASGAPMEGCQPETFAAQLRQAALVLRPAAELHYGTLGEQLDTFREVGLQVYVAQNGVHGASMLNGRRVYGDAEANWQAVLAFLHRVALP